MTRILVASFLAILVVGCSNTRDSRVFVSSAEIDNGTVTVHYAGSACVVNTEQEVRIEGQAIFVHMIEEISNGTCVLFSPGVTQELDLPDSLEVTEDFRIMSSRCVNASCSETELVQVNVDRLEIGDLPELPAGYIGQTWSGCPDAFGIAARWLDIAFEEGPEEIGQWLISNGFSERQGSAHWFESSKLVVNVVQADDFSRELVDSEFLRLAAAAGSVARVTLADGGC